MKIVLVVEGDPLHARLIRKSLCRSQGTMVTVAESAQLALDALSALAREFDDDQVVHPDLILLNVGLPDCSELELLRSIRQDKRLRSTPVVMLSCCQDDTVVEECIESGANAFVVKSARWEDLHSCVIRIGEFWTSDYCHPGLTTSRTPAA